MGAGILEQRLSCFVDRDEQMEALRAMLAGGTKRVLSVCGDEGLGKTFLMERMIQECATRQWRTVKVVCREHHNAPLFIMQSLCDTLAVKLPQPADAPGPSYVVQNIFNAPVDVARNLHMGEGASIGTITGVIVNVDVMADRSDELARREKQRLGQITAAFVESLAQVVRDVPVVVFIDDCHKMPKETDTWLGEELVYAIDGPLVNMYLVLFGQRDADFGSRNYLVRKARLKPFTRDDIAAYLEKRGLEAAGPLTTLLLRVTDGRVSEIQAHVDGIVEG